MYIVSYTMLTVKNVGPFPKVESYCIYTCIYSSSTGIYRYNSNKSFLDCKLWYLPVTSKASSDLGVQLYGNQDPPPPHKDKWNLLQQNEIVTSKWKFVPENVARLNSFGELLWLMLHFLIFLSYQSIVKANEFNAFIRASKNKKWL